jgi:hypothetical protein
MKFIVCKNREQFGPFEMSEVQRYVNTGVFRLTDYCFQEGWESWRFISSIVSRIPGSEENLGGEKNESPQLKQISEQHLSVDSKKAENKDNEILSEENHLVKKTKTGREVSAQMLTNIANFGLLNYSENGNSEKNIYLARNGEMLECSDRYDIATKLSKGELLPDDWFYDNVSKKWKKLKESAW